MVLSFDDGIPFDFAVAFDALIGPSLGQGDYALRSGVNDTSATLGSLDGPRLVVVVD